VTPEVSSVAGTGPTTDGAGRCRAGPVLRTGRGLPCWRRRRL